MNIIICLAAFLASGLTFFSGFGLGTLLTPVFALFFPIDFAIAMTAIVHFLNNLFKLVLVGRHANKSIVFHFGAPAILAAVVGAWVLVRVSALPPWVNYSMGESVYSITPVKAVIGFLLIGFSLLEILPSLSQWKVSRKYLWVGGLLSGFFGGLSGHQGALRSAFLAKSGLSKEGFIATGVVIACLIDVIRLSVYAEHISKTNFSANLWILFLATASAFCGAYLGNRFLKKMTMHTLQSVVAGGLVLIGIALVLGVI